MTVESPILYNIQNVVEELKRLDTEMVQGTRGDKQGPLYGKLIRFVQRLESKIMDKRLNFLFNNDTSLLGYNWFAQLIEKLLGYGNENGVKVLIFLKYPQIYCH